MSPTELQRIREALGLTQAEFVEEFGVHRVTVARWETGDRNIPEPVPRLIQRIGGARTWEVWASHAADRRLSGNSLERDWKVE